MKTLVNPVIFRHMTSELSFWEKHRLELRNEGKTEMVGFAAWLAVVCVAALWLIPQIDRAVLAIMSATFGAGFLYSAIALSKDESRRSKIWRQLREKVTAMEHVFKLGNTSNERDDELVGAIRRYLINFAKPVISFQNPVVGLRKLVEAMETNDPRRSFQVMRLQEYEKDIENGKNVMNTALDYAKACLGDRIDNGHGLAMFFRQAEVELK